MPEGNSRPAGDAINEALGQSDYKSFAAFVAFASVDGINQLRDSFNNFTDAGGDIRLYIGVDLHGTKRFHALRKKRKQPSMPFESQGLL